MVIYKKNLKKFFFPPDRSTKALDSLVGLLTATASIYLYVLVTYYLSTVHLCLCVCVFLFF